MPFFLCVLCVLGVEYGNELFSAQRIFNQFMLPIEPLAPLASMTMRRTCGPAERVMPAFESVAHVCQPPVSGMTNGPVLSTPFTSRWNVPPTPLDASRTSIE